MELYDILICIEPFKYPHTGDSIRNTIIFKIISLGLINKVKVAVTDNGSNIVKAICELEEAQYQLLSKYENSEVNQDVPNSSTDQDLLDLLLELFKPIKEATEWLGGQKYCMLLLIYSTIQVLKYDYVVVEEENDE
ncbi:26111_t:CDS:2, partial [Gigaspora margarita]